MEHDFQWALKKLCVTVWGLKKGKLECLRGKFICQSNLRFRRNNWDLFLTMECCTSAIHPRGYCRIRGSMPNQSTCFVDLEKANDIIPWSDLFGLVQDCELGGMLLPVISYSIVGARTWFTFWTWSMPGLLFVSDSIHNFYGQNL